ncbi:hypothetical protein [Pseudomonas sp. VD-NE ext]|uniref:glycine-rich domain-containing protein n=1 Tax=Pseudomonas sp. VD-NE ext TaxID=3075583 RepID=UPI0028929D5A|nr:hypothetical protein [Pseudomonas sp. VD-NE ext]
MDYPISVPNIGLVGGKFVNEDSFAGTPGSLIPAQWGNAVTDEIVNVITGAGLVPTEASVTQLLAAIRLINKQPVILNATGPANAYAAVNTPALTAFPANGYLQRLLINNANTGPSTYAPDGLVAKPIYGLALQPLQGGELPGGIAVLRYVVQPGVNSGNGAWVINEAPGARVQIPQGTAGSHAMRLDQAVGRLINIQTFTSSGTYTPSAGTRAIRIRLIGGGGGGGGSTTTAAGQISFGTGGSSGSYAEGLFTVFPASMAVSVGAAGSGVTGVNGTAGGSSSVGSLISVNGGSPGGVFGPVGAPITGVVVPTGISITGAYLAVPSEAAIMAFVTSTTTGFSGAGGNGKLGAGGTAVNSAGTGQSGRGYGGGGGGRDFIRQPTTC